MLGLLAFVRSYCDVAILRDSLTVHALQTMHAYSVSASFYVKLENLGDAVCNVGVSGQTEACRASTVLLWPKDLVVHLGCVVWLAAHVFLAFTVLLGLGGYSIGKGIRPPSASHRMPQQSRGPWRQGTPQHHKRPPGL